MKRSVVLAALIAVLPVAAQAMTVAEFVTKAEKLQVKGMGAMFSPDLKLVVAEVRAVATAYRADLDAAPHPRRAELGCPPPKGKVKFSQAEFMKDFVAVPVGQRAITSVKTVYYAMMKKRYPCR